MKTKRIALLLSIISAMALAGCTQSTAHIALDKEAPVIIEDKATTYVKPEVMLSKAQNAKTKTITKDGVTIAYKSGNFSVFDEDGKEVFRKKIGYTACDETGKIVFRSEGRYEKDENTVISDTTLGLDQKGYDMSSEGMLTLKKGKYIVVTEDGRSVFTGDDKNVTVIYTDGKVVA